MSPKSISSRNSIDSCLFQLNSWKPFSNSKTLDHNPKPNPNHNSGGIHSKRQCLTDRSTSLFSLSIDAIDFSKLSLFDDPRAHRANHHHHHGNHQSRMEKLRWSSMASAAKKRRRKGGGSRSVSGRSSERCRSLGAATGSDFIMARSGAGTDSSGELFNGWGSDVGEGRRESSINGNVGEVGPGFGFDGVGGSESGYGSEPGYRGDVEFGYGDEVDDEEEEGARLLFLWGQSLGVARDSNTEMVGENTFSEQKTHHRGRRKKHDLRMVDSVR
ncbi:hypothetical protein vseg_010495 [Gypsophila vaccaria]